jgi:hypothetical protein
MQIYSIAISSDDKYVYTAGGSDGHIKQFSVSDS